MNLFLFLKWWGKVPILRSIQYITYKYGDFQKASGISLVETSISINSIRGLYHEIVKFICSFVSVLLWRVNGERECRGERNEFSEVQLYRILMTRHQKLHFWVSVQREGWFIEIAHRSINLYNLQKKVYWTKVSAHWNNAFFYANIGNLNPILFKPNPMSCLVLLCLVFNV